MKSVGLFSREDLTNAHNIKKKSVSRKDIDSRVAMDLPPESIARKLGKQVRPYVQDGAQVLVIGYQADAMKESPLTGRIATITYELDFANVPYALDAMVRTTATPPFAPSILASALTSQVRDSVALIKPAVVIATHTAVVRALIPEISDAIANVRGRPYPARVGDHFFWVVPTHDPRVAVPDDYDRMPMWFAAVSMDARLAARLVQDKETPDTTFMRMSKAELLKLGVYERRRGERAEALRNFASVAGDVVCLDYETNTLKPWRHKRPAITAISFSDGEHTISIPFDHPEFDGDPERDDIVEAFLSILKGRTIVAHNVLFELWWTFTVFGVDAVFSVNEWLCTQVGAYVDFVRVTENQKRDDDSEKGVAGTSLDHQCLLRFGISVKDLSPAESWDYRKTPLREFLTYNALDSFFGFKLYEDLVRTLKRKKLYKTFVFRNQRSIFLAWSTIRGFPISQEVVEELHEEVTSKMRSIETQIHQSDEVRRFEKKFGKFSMTPDQVGKLFEKICGLSLNRTAKGKVATTKEDLLAIGEKYPIAKMIVASREIDKARTTYIERLRRNHPETYLGIDGYAHPQRVSTKAVTGRHSHDDMNVANYPKRGYWYKIRGSVRAPEGWKVVSGDLGQIEARIIAIASQDPVFRNAVINGLDVHKDWAERLERLDYEWYESHNRLDAYVPLHERHGKSDVGGLRGIAKNKWVFPAFFGSGVGTLASGMLLDKDLVAVILKENFWPEFAGVKAWHKQLHKFYQKHFYVETLTGLRIHGPLTYNEVINYPIQGTASDILQNSAAKLTKKAYELRRKWLVPWADIHDDLSFFMPDRHLEWGIETLAEALVRPAFKFIDIPITAEILVGQSWYKQEPIGVFSSADAEMKVDLSNVH